MNNEIEKGTEQFAPVSMPQNISALTDNNTKTNIAQTNENCQAVPQHKGKRERKILSMESKVYSVAIKCYDEQLSNGWDCVKNLIKGMDKTQFIVIGICHDRDEITGGIWDVAKEKQHYHIICKCIGQRSRVSTICNKLGICFRKGLDDNLLKNRGIESVGNFANYAVYLTHETEDAIKDGKELYSLDECVSNLDKDEIERIRAGYKGFGKEVQKVTLSMLSELDKEAYNLGYNFGDFNKWYGSLSFSVRCNVKFKTVRESYNRGVFDAMSEDRDLVRLCIYIKGEPGIGKTYAARGALADKRVLCVNGGGTGKFDNLRPDHEAIIIDDDICDNLLNMTDNRPCYVYRRNRNNPPFTGPYFIVTNNNIIVDWAERCGIRCYKRDSYRYLDMKNDDDSFTDVYKALLSRFYVCYVAKDATGRYRLFLDSPSTRGTPEEQRIRYEMFKEFKAKFDEIIATYTPDNTTVDYSDLLGEYEQVKKDKATIEKFEEMLGVVAGIDLDDCGDDINDDVWLDVDEHSEKYRQENLGEIIRIMSNVKCN